MARKSKIIVSLFSFFAPLSAAFAETSPITSAQQIINVMQKLLGYFQVVFWIAAIGAIFYAGFLYLFAGENEKNVDKAKKQLMYAVIAIAIGLMAFGITPLVLSVLKGQ